MQNTFQKSRESRSLFYDLLSDTNQTFPFKKYMILLITHLKLVNKLINWETWPIQELNHLQLPTSYFKLPARTGGLLIVGSKLVTQRSGLVQRPSRNVGFFKLRRRDHTNFGSEKLSERKVEISRAFIKNISYFLIIISCFFSHICTLEKAWRHG